jgi:hypothetical protein
MKTLTYLLFLFDVISLQSCSNGEKKAPATKEAETKAPLSTTQIEEPEVDSLANIPVIV